MSYIKIKSLKIKNYRSFGNQEQEFDFTKALEKKLPLAIVGYNNAGKTNLMNAILFSLQINFVSKDTFSIDDFHFKQIENKPETVIECESSEEDKYEIGKKANLQGYHRLQVFVDGNEIIGSKIQSLKSLQKIQDNQGREKDDENFQAFGALRYYNIFYINFHNIKEEISTQKSSWGNLKSFLAKHIKKLVDEDEIMKVRKPDFKENLVKATNLVLNGVDGEPKSKLSEFIQKIKDNYSTNLGDNKCEINFGLPDYEDIFLQMIFKIGLNGQTDKLVPIDHFGDGYISMFVMAVIQAIAEENTSDQCLFLFEEPESFLHENHQEYFYKMVLCKLSDKGHQVIYTTHSDKMVDILEPNSLIRLKFDETQKQTIKTFPLNNDGGNPLDKSKIIKINDEEIPITEYNSYIKNIEPNLNKILFSEKVILVEGPNDLLVYYYLIRLKARILADTTEKIKDKTPAEKNMWAETYLNFNNIAIIPHHGKPTAHVLAQLCGYLGVNYYMINDWDYEQSELDIAKVMTFSTEDELRAWDRYKSEPDPTKGMITTNWKLFKNAKHSQIHFNIKKLESVIDYNGSDKNPVKIWHSFKKKFFKIEEVDGVQKYVPDPGKITNDVFPESLAKFLFPIVSDESTITETIRNSGKTSAIELDSNSNPDLPFQKQQI